jgi:hypothetical protein
MAIGIGFNNRHDLGIGTKIVNARKIMAQGRKINTRSNTRR